MGPPGPVTGFPLPFTNFRRFHLPCDKLTPTYEEHDSIDYLDLTILWKHKKLEVNIYRKPTTTDKTINFMSNYPTEQKTTAYIFHIIRIQFYRWIQTKNIKNEKPYNPLQGKTTFYSTVFKTSTERYITELITHTIEIKTTKEFGPHLLTIVPKYGKLPTCLEIPRKE
jgi:hypothetical protein